MGRIELPIFYSLLMSSSSLLQCQKNTATAEMPAISKIRRLQVVGSVMINMNQHRDKKTVNIERNTSMF
jgi:hypothetical protein